jgi:hypothetical protein
MAKEPSQTYTGATVETGGPMTGAPKPKKKGNWKITAVLFLVVLPLAAFALWVTVALNFSFSSGDRAGYVQKISKKGWLCKTYEGEITLANGPNVVAEKFIFTVRDDSVAAQISNAAGRQVKLSYDQHRGLPTSCFGETEYFVKKVEMIGALPAAGVTVPTPAPIPAPVVPGATLPPATPPAIPPATPPTTSAPVTPAVPATAP